MRTKFPMVGVVNMYVLAASCPRSVPVPIMLDGGGGHLVVLYMLR